MAEARDEHRPAPAEAGAEHAHGVDLAVRRQRADDPGARRPVAAEVALAVLLGDRRAALVDDDRDRAVHRPDVRVARLDAAVEDAHPDAGPARAAERPGASHPLRPAGLDADAPCRLGPEAPRWKRAIGLGHRPSLRLPLEQL